MPLKMFLTVSTLLAPTDMLNSKATWIYHEL